VGCDGREAGVAAAAAAAVELLVVRLRDPGSLDRI